MKLFLAEIPVWNGSAETTLKYASGLGYTNGSDWYAPRIENPATYSVSLNAGGLASGSYGELTLVNVDGALDALADYAVDGRFLTLKYGDESAAYNSFTTVLVAMMESISLERDRVSIRLRDPVRQLDKPITARTYAGTGGLAGDATLKDTPKPIVVGEATFIRPVLIDAARLIYQVHDGYVAAIVQVLNKAGYPITSGGDFASESALLNDAVTAGYFKTWRTVNGSYIKLGSDPDGEIAVNVAEYASGGNIGLLPGSALFRLVTNYGHVITQPVTTSGTAQSVATDRTTITLATGASATNDAYNGQYIKVIDGDAVQVRSIVDYDGSTKVATLDVALQTLTDTTPDYEIATGVLGYTSEMEAVDDGYIDTDITGTVPEADPVAAHIKIANGASDRPNAYKDKTISITGGTGSGQSRTIDSYYPPTPLNGLTYPLVVVTPNWTTNPDTTSTYAITETTAEKLRNSGVGIFSDNADNLKTLMDRIAASVHAWYAFDATNKLRMGLFRDPADETAAATLTEDNVISLDRVTDSNPESLPNWRVTVTSGKRWKPLNANDAIPASLINLTKDWTNTSKQTDSAVKPIHKLSTERSFESLMIDADGRRGEALATDLLDLYSARHDTVNATVADPNLEFTAIDIGKVVSVTLNRFGYTNGRNMRVISLRRDFQRGLLDLTLWG